MIGECKIIMNKIDNFMAISNLPDYDKKLISKFEKSLALTEAGTPDNRLDCYVDELASEINNLEVNEIISSEQAWYLREHYLGFTK